MRQKKERNPMAGMLIALFLALMFILPSSMVQGASSSDTATKAPFIAYKAKTIPRIDGVLSPSEWDDAKPYWHEGADTHDGATAICLKHDAHTLYIVATVKDNKSDDGDEITIGVRPPDYSGGMVWEYIEIYADGTVSDSMERDKGAPPGPSPIKNAASYVNGIYTFEIAMNLMYYFNSTEGNLSFSILYEDGDWLERYPIILPRSSLYYTRFCDSFSPGILISSDYYNGTQHMYDVVWNLYEPSGISPEQGFLYLVGACVAVTSAIIGVIIWKSRKKK